MQNKIIERMVTVNTGTTELDFGVEVISRQSPSLFLLHTSKYSKIPLLCTGPAYKIRPYSGDMRPVLINCLPRDYAEKMQN